MASATTAASGPTRLDGVQALRGLAALAVVVHHALEQSNGAQGAFSPDWLTVPGAAGVDVFFVISGFIMMWTGFPAGRAPLQPLPFLYRRVTRIYPLYWLTCLGILMLSAVGLLHSHRYDAPLVLRSLALLPGSGIVGPAWSLVFEVWFYALFALLLPLRSARAMVIGLPLLLTAAATGGLFLPEGPVRSLLQSPLPLEFCMGLVLGLVSRQAPAVLAVANRFAVIAALAAIVAAAVLVPRPDTSGLPEWPRALVWGLPALVIVAAGLRWAPSGRIGGWLVRLGDSSYALYLTHLFVMIAYGRALKVGVIGALPQALPVVVVTALAVGVGFLAYALAERPIMAGLRRIDQLRTQLATSAAAGA